MTDEYQIIQVSRTKTTLDGSEWFEGQDAGGGEDSSFKCQAEAFANIGVGRIDHATSEPLTAGNINSLHTNIGAVVDILLDLPPALIGLGGLFYCTPGYRIALSPNGTDTIMGGGAGKNLTILEEGILSLDCVSAAGNWTARFDGMYEIEA